MVAAVQHEDGRPGWPEGRRAVWGVSDWKPWAPSRKPGTSRVYATECFQTSHYAVTDNVCEAILFLEPIVRGPCYTVGPGNEKQTRTLTDAEDNCEDVCVVLICGWSVGVLSQHPPLGQCRLAHVR